jgi:hypothetical protein
MVTKHNNGGPGQQSKNNASPPLRFAWIATITVQAGHGGAAALNLHAVAKEAELWQLDIVFAQESKFSNEKYVTRAGNFDNVVMETLTTTRGRWLFLSAKRKAQATRDGKNLQDCYFWMIGVVIGIIQFQHTPVIKRWSGTWIIGKVEKKCSEFLKCITFKGLCQKVRYP